MNPFAEAVPPFPNAMAVRGMREIQRREAIVKKEGIKNPTTLPGEKPLAELLRTIKGSVYLSLCLSVWLSFSDKL